MRVLTNKNRGTDKQVPDTLVSPGRGLSRLAAAYSRVPAVQPGSKSTAGRTGAGNSARGVGSAFSEAKVFELSMRTNKVTWEVK